MERGYQKIFWGLFFVTFHLNLGPLQLLPPFVGWLVVISGVHELNSSLQNSAVSTVSFQRAIIYGRWLVGLTLMDTVGTLATGASIMAYPVFLYYPIIVITLEIITFFHVLEGTHTVFSELKLEDRKVETQKKLRTYMVMGLSSALILTFTLFFNHSSSMVIGVLVGIIATIYLLVYLSQLKKVWKQHPLEKEMDDEREVVISREV